MSMSPHPSGRGSPRNKVVARRVTPAEFARLQQSTPSSRRLSDAGMELGGVFVRRAGAGSSKHVEVVTSRKSQYFQHEVEHGQAIALAHVAGFGKINTNSWLALMIEFGLPTRQPPFSKRPVEDPARIRQWVDSSLLRDRRWLVTLHASLSRLFPNDEAYRRALFNLVRNKRMRPALDSLNTIAFGTSTFHPFKNADKAKPAIAILVDRLIDASKRAK